MSPPAHPLGYRAASAVLQHGRAAFFRGKDDDLPQGRAPRIAADDRIPQFGYVGADYKATRVLMLGINPGNGPNERRDSGDELVMPPLEAFVAQRSPDSFLAAQRAYQTACEAWPIWRRHCSSVIGSGRLGMNEIAFSNCLRWRAASESGFADSVANQACRLYAYPLIDELEPRVVIAMGKRAAEILRKGGRSLNDLIVWNRAQAATAAVLDERASTAKRILQAVSRAL